MGGKTSGQKKGNVMHRALTVNDIRRIPASPRGPRATRRSSSNRRRINRLTFHRYRTRGTHVAKRERHSPEFTDHGKKMTRRVLLFSVALLSLGLPTFAAHSVFIDTDVSAPIVLCYHIVESPQDPRMEISRDTFLQHMRYLALTGYSVISLRDAYEYATG